MSEPNVEPTAQNIPLGGQPVRSIGLSSDEQKAREVSGSEKAKSLWQKHAEMIEKSLVELGAGLSDAEKELRSHLMWSRHFVGDKIALLK